jgi:hypothetical protein
MKNSEFIALIGSNTNKTTHIRTYSGTWYTGASRVPDELTTKIGRVIALIQSKINEGLICNQNTECLLIYNFQPGAIPGNLLYCHLDILIKPIADIHKTNENVGRPFQLAVDGNSGYVVNMTKSIIDLGLMTEEEAREEGLEPPKIYGAYNNIKAICCFAALSSYKPISDINSLFNGEYDLGESIQHSVAYDSMTEARSYLASRNELGRYILEVISSKEDYPYVLKKGVSKSLFKVMNYFDMSATLTPNHHLILREDKIEDQLGRLELVKHENSLPTHNSSVLDKEKYNKEDVTLPSRQNQPYSQAPFS